MFHVCFRSLTKSVKETSKRHESQSIWEMEDNDKVYLITKVNGPSECRQNYKKVTHLYLMKIKLRTNRQCCTENYPEDNKNQ